MSGGIRWALPYAWQLSWRVFPCKPGEKIPLIKEWPERATTDRNVITSWWERWPDANIAVATGSGSGIFVLDVDGAEGEQSLTKLEGEHGPLPDGCPMQWTGGGRGGWQVFFRWPEGREIRNSAGQLGAKLDIRGEGGYVLLPPSRTAQAYSWGIERDPWSCPPIPGPAWLLALLDPPVAATAWRAPEAPTGDRYVWRAVESELALLSAAGQGRRNDQLNRSAHALYRFVADGRLHRSDVDDGLMAAARQAGLRDREIAATINSAAAARGLSR
jgi:putative DNA primase/helicase